MSHSCVAVKRKADKLTTFCKRHIAFNGGNVNLRNCISLTHDALERVDRGDCKGGNGWLALARLAATRFTRRK